MNIRKFEKINTVTGLIVFLIALTTYYLTVEPTASYWDAAEYISTSAKLQVGHPPGAPLFQMIGAFFSSFASNPEDIAIPIIIYQNVKKNTPITHPLDRVSIVLSPSF